MSKNLPALFEANQEIKFYEVNGEYCLTAEEIGKGLGYEFPEESINKIVQRYLDEIEPYRVKVNLTFYYTEEGIYIISMLARTEKAKEFRRKVAALLKDLRRQRLEAVRRDAATSALALHMRVERMGKDKSWLKRLIHYRNIGLSQKDTGRLLDCSKDTVGRYEAELKKTGLWEAL